jgi:hypothetical protein
LLALSNYIRKWLLWETNQRAAGAAGASGTLNAKRERTVEAPAFGASTVRSRYVVVLAGGGAGLVVLAGLGPAA